MPMGVVVVHATLVPYGVSSHAFWGKWVRMAHEALSFCLWASDLGGSCGYLAAIDS